ncbi:hypothetical protein M5U04_06805 [Xenorhabdus sp. XENO-1]|uniref:hypothetical protein n=1 Tax=Xenorhabdus bovienii TaxID=40576 RepID=UPI0020CA915C|nr:hypothetical protein [Xenorhabdus bovienii]MCP9267816.1 hypothetical protein [Xenorhabdus bovienii subsp. africana]
MKKLLLGLTICFSSSTFAMSENCTIATQMFEDAGMVMVDAMEMAVNDGETLKTTTVSYDEFSNWYKNVYPKKISRVMKKYDQYKTVSGNNPITLGLVTILETNNFAKATDNYMQSKDKSLIKPITDTQDRITKAYERLAQDCGKR